MKECLKKTNIAFWIFVVLAVNVAIGVLSVLFSGYFSIVSIAKNGAMLALYVYAAICSLKDTPKKLVKPILMIAIATAIMFVLSFGAMIVHKSFTIMIVVSLCTVAMWFWLYWLFKNRDKGGEEGVDLIVTAGFWLVVAAILVATGSGFFSYITPAMMFVLSIEYQLSDQLSVGAIIGILVLLALSVGVLMFICAICDIGVFDDSSRYEWGGEDYGANFDWGDNYYWDTNKHSVQRKLW